MKFTDIVCTLIVFLVGLLEPVAAVCCPCFGSVCGDKTPCTPCCSTKPCNIFCCNCDAGCRGDSDTSSLYFPFSKDENSTEICVSKFTVLDTNQDGKLSFLEWAFSTETQSYPNFKALAERWSQFDLEGKGFLTRDEAIDRKAWPKASGSSKQGCMQSSTLQQPITSEREGL